MAQILTVGHSTHPIDRFLELLRGAGVETVADVRRYPGSRRNPQFGAAALGESLDRAGIALEPFGDALGGRRSRSGGRPGEEPHRHRDNSAWRNDSFRAYADYMGTAEFEAGLGRLEALARDRCTAIMCAEAQPWRCHRRLIADALLVRGWDVLDLFGDGSAPAHALSPHAAVDGETVSYPGQPSLDI